MGSPLDRYQNFQFHLFDITPTQYGTDVTPLFIMSPQAAFSEVSEPSIEIDTVEVKSGTSHMPRTVVKAAKCANITLSKGLYTGDQEFYDWVMQAVSGRGQYRRTLGLVQIHGQPLVVGGAEINSQRYLSMMALAGLAFSAQDLDSNNGDLASPIIEAEALVGGFFAGRTGIHTPACRIWTLYDCIPVSYNAGDGFSATSDDVTIASIEISVDGFDEYSFGVNGNFTGV